MLNPMRVKTRPRSLWCRRTVIGHRARPFVGLILEAGYFEVACRVQARVAFSRTLKCVAGVDSTACKDIMLRDGVGQLRGSLP